MKMPNETTIQEIATNSFEYDGTLDDSASALTGQFVAISGGQIVDYDFDRRDLIRRVFKTVTNSHVLILKISRDYESVQEAADITSD